MSNEHSCACLFVPDDRKEAAIQAAIQERPDNAPRNAKPAPTHAPGGFKPPVMRMAVEVARLWAPGRTLRVSMRGGSVYVRSKVKQYAMVWTQYANIHFNFVDQEPAEIRVAFIDNDRSWSAVGTDATTTPAAEPTMNFGWFDDNTEDIEFSRTVTHEFGHAIGCIHEQSQPNAHIEWNKPNVYAYYAKMGWSQEDVDFNVFYKYDPAGISASDYDPTSIMQYPVPPGFTTNGFVVGWNSYLSQRDIDFIKKCYPKTTKPATMTLATGTLNTMQNTPAQNVGAVEPTLPDASIQNILPDPQAGLVQV